MHMIPSEAILIICMLHVSAGLFDYIHGSVKLLSLCENVFVSCVVLFKCLKIVLHNT